MLQSTPKTIARSLVFLVPVVLLPLFSCEGKVPVGAHELSVAELAALDDHDPAYEGHLEMPVERPWRIVDDADSPDYGETLADGPCPLDATVECGQLHCCPEGLACTTGPHAGERYCANRANGAIRQPCLPITGVQVCGDGLQCRSVPAHDGGPRPHICTKPCEAPGDCAGIAEGFCCVLGFCHHVAGECTEGLAVRANGYELHYGRYLSEAAGSVEEEGE